MTAAVPSGGAAPGSDETHFTPRGYASQPAGGLRSVPARCEVLIAPATLAVADLRLSSRAAQQVFRAVLDALSRPGRAVRLPDVPGVPPALAPLAALADLDTPFHLLGADTDAVATATSAPPAELGSARLVTALRPVTLAELARVRIGTPAAPEDAALVMLAVPALHGGPALQLTGPGTGSGVGFAPVGLPDGWTATRAAFPTGYDLLLVDPNGQCAGVPRSTVIAGEG